MTSSAVAHTICMNVSNTVKSSLLYYPSIFKNALDVYNHLFFVIGNGYDWVDGELVSGSEKHGGDLSIKSAVMHEIDHICNRTEKSIDPIFLRVIGKLSNNDENDAGKSMIDKEVECVVDTAAGYIKRDLSDTIPLILDTPEREKDFDPYLKDDKRYSDFIMRSVKDWKWKIYPPSIEYSYVCNFPKETKADWLIAIDWTAMFLKAHPECWPDEVSEDDVNKILEKTYTKMKEALEFLSKRSSASFWSFMYRAKEDSFYLSSGWQEA